MKIKEIIQDLKNPLIELKNLVENKTLFSIGEFSELIHCLECLDRKIINQIRNNGLINIHE